jgi:hypothetical protein
MVVKEQETDLLIMEESRGADGAGKSTSTK